MKGYFGVIAVFSITLVQFGDAIEKIYKCLPTGIDDFCQLHHVFYKRNSSVSYVFPKNYKHVRIGTDGWLGGVSSVIEHFDGQMYTELGIPLMLEIMTADMKSLVIPRQLHHGGFANNLIEWFSVDDGHEAPEIEYLDLSKNYLKNVSNISSFTNLVQLNLISNRIHSLEGQTFKPLVKLQVLYLNYNSLTELHGESYPPSLLYLSFYGNDIVKINYTGLSLPNLEVLNLERNKLPNLTLPRLLDGVSNLRFLLLGGNDLKHSELRSIIQILKQRNISQISDGDEEKCYHSEVEIEGVCVGHELIATGWLKATMLTMLTLVILIGIVLITWWVLRQMSR